jgi:hypothetical protein
MIKTKLLVTLAVVTAGLALSATPAFAEFESNPAGTSEGPAQLLGNATLSLSPTAPPLVCEELTKGVWKIRTKTPQSKILKGPHLNLSGQFAKCKAILSAETSLPATVNPTCELQVAQISTGNNIVNGSVAANCIITIEAVGCIVTVPTKGNTLLTKAVLSKINATTTEIHAKIGGITNEVNEACKNNGLANGNGKEGKFEAQIQTHGQTYV